MTNNVEIITRYFILTDFYSYSNTNKIKIHPLQEVVFHTRLQDRVRAAATMLLFLNAQLPLSPLLIRKRIFIFFYSLFILKLIF